MKRKFADRSNWARVTKKRFNLTYIEEKDFKGHLSIFYIDEVRDPLVKKVLGKRLVLADSGYIWMQHFPQNCNYSLTTMFNRNKEIVQWYYDICKGNKITAQGIPFYEDMFLDVVVLPSSHILLLDEEELEEAFMKGSITKREYDRAWQDAKQLIEEIQAGENALLKRSLKDLQYILSLE